MLLAREQLPKDRRYQLLLEPLKLLQLLDTVATPLYQQSQRTHIGGPTQTGLLRTLVSPPADPRIPVEVPRVSWVVSLVLWCLPARWN